MLDGNYARTDSGEVRQTTWAPGGRGGRDRGGEQTQRSAFLDEDAGASAGAPSKLDLFDGNDVCIGVPFACGTETPALICLPHRVVSM